MESILARALEYTLKYWLKSFSRDQFKLQGRTVQLSNLDINGDALHSSIGLPPALNVTTAKVGKLVIMLPAVSNVQIEPIIVQIDRLDLVLEENQDVEACKSASSPSSSSSTSSGWSSGYGFADKIADGMSVQINTVNLLLETRGGSREKGGAAWASPMASITMRNLMLYTTNENWEVVNLKEARDFFSSNKFIYVFKKLEWESLSVDLLPHPDMFTESNLERANEGANKRDDDGAKRVFFGGERFIEGISGEAYITVKRTELNRPLGLEVQLHINEVICPALSEPGLRALLRFLTGLYICLNRGDVDIMAQERSVEAAGISLVSLVVEHIFLCLKDAEFKLDILMQSLRFSRMTCALYHSHVLSYTAFEASVSDGENANNLTTVMIGGLFLRDTFSRPPCTLVQPSMQAFTENTQEVPAFAKNFCPPIYPLGEQDWQRTVGIPLICLYSLQVKPSPDPPVFASETFINCQPLTIYLQEESCLRISSFLAYGIVVGPGAILPDASINSFTLVLKELDVTVPLEMEKVYTPKSRKSIPDSSFDGAKLHIEDLLFKESPFLKLKLLNLETDPACFCFWQGQPVDASQKKWTTKASRISLCLEASSDFNKLQQSTDWTSDLWRCVEFKDVCVEVAMATPDGNPLTEVPPPGGIVRVGVACQEYISNSSVEQLFFVLSLYGYIGRVSDKIAIVGKGSRANNKIQDKSVGGTARLMDRVPADTAVSLIVANLQLRFLESTSVNAEGTPLVQFIGDDFFMKVSHRTLGGAVAVSSNLHWDSVEIDCIDTERTDLNENDLGNGNLSQCSKLRAVLWIHNKKKDEANGSHGGGPFLEIGTTQVIPFNEQDSESSSLNLSAGVSGIRLGGGMNYTESLLHRFGILGLDGGPGKGLLKGLENLSSGPLAKLFKAAPLHTDDTKGDGEDILPLTKPENVDVTVELKDWLFALEGPEQIQERWQQYDNHHNHAGVDREERSWHMSFQSLQVAGKSDPKQWTNCKEKYVMRKYPIESVTIGIKGLQTVKPQIQSDAQSFSNVNGNKETVQSHGGINVEARMAVPRDNLDGDGDAADWVVDNLKFSVKNPVEAVVTKEELQHLVFLCKSEVDSMGRIAAGVLRLLKLENSIGQAAITQLSNLGSEGIDKILTPKHIRKSSFLGCSDQEDTDDIHTTVASLEESVSDSQSQCNSILHALSNNPGSSSDQDVSDMQQLSQKLQHMEFLLKELRRQI